MNNELDLHVLATICGGQSTDRPNETTIRSRVSTDAELQPLRCWDSTQIPNYQFCVPETWAQQGQFANASLGPRDWFASQK